MGPPPDHDAATLRDVADRRHGAGLRPRVLFVSPAAFGPSGIYGGGERYAEEVAQAVARRTPATLLTFARGGSAPRRAREGRLVRRTLPSWTRSPTNGIHPALPALVARHDVVHCFQYYALATAAAAAAGRLLGKRCVVTDLGGGGFTPAYWFDLGPWIARLACLSEHAATLLSHVSAARTVLHGGVDPEFFSPAGSSRERKAVFLGRLIRAKGVENAIRGLPPGFSLVVVGRPYDAAYGEELRGLAAERGAPVRFVFDADDRAVREELRTATALVHPSVDRLPDGTRVPHTELFGLAVCEAMACATPVVASRVASLPEIVVDGETGFLVPPGDEAAIEDRLSRLAADPALVGRMGRAGRALVLERFTWEAVADRCLALYREVLEEGRRR